MTHSYSQAYCCERIVNRGRRRRVNQHFETFPKTRLFSPSWCRRLKQRLWNCVDLFSEANSCQDVRESHRTDRRSITLLELNKLTQAAPFSFLLDLLLSASVGNVSSSCSQNFRLSSAKCCKTSPGPPLCSLSCYLFNLWWTAIKSHQNKLLTVAKLSFLTSSCDDELRCVHPWQPASQPVPLHWGRDSWSHLISWLTLLLMLFGTL